MTQIQYAQLRIFTDELAPSGDIPLWEDILNHAKSHGLLGLTVIRGWLGYGPRKLNHELHLPDPKYPLIIEIIDEESLLRTFAEEVGPMHGIGLVTLSPVDVLHGKRQVES